MRQLATIQRISAIRPIEGADAIELAFVLGWQVVVKKDDFQVGDLAVYFEIDSFLDESMPAMQEPAFQDRFINWTDPDGKVRRGMRLKTIKLRKQLSQGLILPISAFPELSPSVMGLDKLTEGTDVTELLKLAKWEPYEETKGNGPRQQGSGNDFPAFIQKTDQNRVQNYINLLENHLGDSFEVTIKLDGSSMTVYCVHSTSPAYNGLVQSVEKRMLKKMGTFKRFWWKLMRKLGRYNPPDEFYGVCSRNVELDINGSSHFAEYVRKHDLFTKIRGGTFFGESYAFQGELIAPSIQQNHEKVSDYEFYIFDVFDIDSQTYLLPAQARRVAQACGFKYVPVLATAASLRDYGPAGEVFDPKTTVDGILAFAEGPGMNLGVKREGVVFKSNSTPFSFKAISNSYLLKKG